MLHPEAMRELIRDLKPVSHPCRPRALDSTAPDPHGHYQWFSILATAQALVADVHSPNRSTSKLESSKDTRCTQLMTGDVTMREVRERRLASDHHTLPQTTQ